MKEIFKSVDSDATVRAVLIYGSGVGFCAGIDRDLLLDISRDHTGALQKIEELQSAFLSVRSCKVPVIACIHGSCLGAGLDLVALCDMRYASSCATLSSREIRLGIAPDLGSIPALGTAAWAVGAILTGADIPAKDVPWFFSAPLTTSPAEALAVARLASSKVATANPGAIRLIKANLPRKSTLDFSETFARLARGNVALL